MAQLLDPEQWGRGSGGSGPDGRGFAPQSRDDDVPDDRPPGPRRTGAPAPRAGAPGGAAEGEWNPFGDEPAAPSNRQPRTGARQAAPAGSPPGPPRRSSGRPLILGGVLGVLTIVAAGIWAAASGLLPLGGGAPAPQSPAASAPATLAPAPTDPPSAPAEPAGTPLPASCDDIYSGSMRGGIESAGLLLNPEWHQSSGETRLPSEDRQLQEMLGAVERLDCAWLQESPGEVAIYTSIARVTGDQAAAANARMIELGYSGVEELGGVRYVTETSGDGNALGESHFVRDGLWFGTLWINYGPAGYTADMVGQVLG